MQVNAFTPVFVFAANTYLNRTDELDQVRRHLELPELKAVVGCYQGQEEQSYIVSTADIQDRSRFEQFLHDNDQDCVLFLDNQRSGWLYAKADGYKHGDNTQYLGTFRKVNAQLAKKLGNYTFNPESGEYFTCSK